MGSFEEYVRRDREIRTSLPMVLGRADDKYATNIPYSEEIALALLGIHKESGDTNRTSVSSSIAESVTRRVRGMQTIGADELRAIVVSCIASVSIECKV